MPVKVLIVEDEESLLTAYAIKLRREGYDPIEARTGSLGISLAAELLPDVILLDMLLGRVSGLDVLDALKSDARTRDIPVIVLTNSSSPVDAKNTIARGAASYHVKAHVSMDDVVSEIRRFTARG